MELYQTNRPAATGLIRCTRAHPCEVCGRTKYCCHGPRFDLCTKISSDRPAKNGRGWLHFHTSESSYRQIVRETPAVQVRHDLDLLQKHFQSNVNPIRLDAFARRLGLSIGSLRRLGIGWTGRAWSFPMRDAAGKIVGIRLRNDQGEKWAVRGGHEGLFFPDNLPTDDPLLICEGPTDTAAALDLGFSAIGRPCCTGGVRQIIQFCRQRHQQVVVVVADADEPGQNGAQSLASVLRI